MSKPHRVPCEECGDENADKMRMHKEISKRAAERRLNEDVRSSAESVGGTYAQCNICGNIRLVE